MSQENLDHLSWTTPLGLETRISMLAVAQERDRLAHTLLFQGERGNGSEALAIYLMRRLLCSNPGEAPCENCPNCRKTGELAHPDLMIIFPLPAVSSDGGSRGEQPHEQFSQQIRRELARKASNHYYQLEVENGRGILLDQIRSLRRFAGMKSYEGGNRVVLIFDAHLMNLNAQNALLKLAEEPPDNMYLLLATDQPNALLPTIISRCQSLYVPPQSVTAIQEALAVNGVPPVDAERLARLADGNTGKAIAMLQEEEDSIQDTIDLLRLVLGNDTAGLASRLGELTRNRDRKATRQLLTRLIEWIRDVHLQEVTSAESEWIRNRDALPVLTRFVAAYDTGQAGELITLLEEYIARIDKNLYLNSLLYALVFDLRHLIQRRSTMKANHSE